MKNSSNPLRVGIGGPVGNGKTSLCEMLCKAMRDHYGIAVITNDIYSREDMEILLRRCAAGTAPDGCGNRWMPAYRAMKRMSQHAAVRAAMRTGALPIAVDRLSKGTEVVSCLIAMAIEEKRRRAVDA